MTVGVADFGLVGVDDGIGVCVGLTTGVVVCVGSIVGTCVGSAFGAGAHAANKKREVDKNMKLLQFIFSSGISVNLHNIVESPL